MDDSPCERQESRDRQAKPGGHSPSSIIHHWFSPLLEVPEQFMDMFQKRIAKELELASFWEN
jgi:hypothetical protein